MNKIFIALVLGLAVVTTAFAQATNTEKPTGAGGPNGSAANANEHAKENAEKRMERKREQRKQREERRAAAKAKREERRNQNRGKQAN